MPKNPIGLPYRLCLYVRALVFPQSGYWSSGWGCEPTIFNWGRVSRFCAPVRHFSPPHLYSFPQISPSSDGIRWMAFGLRKEKVLGYSSVQLISKIYNCVITIHQTAGRADRRTTCDGKTALFTIVHRTVKLAITVKNCSLTYRRHMH